MLILAWVAAVWLLTLVWLALSLAARPEREHPKPPPPQSPVRRAWEDAA